MIKIKRGKVEHVVTRPAYEALFKKQGFEIVFDSASDDVQAEQHLQQEESTDDMFVDELMEKPISEWKSAEVKRFASIKGIDLQGTKNANEAKDRIKDFLEKEEDGE